MMEGLHVIMPNIGLAVTIVHRTVSGIAFHPGPKQMLRHRLAALQAELRARRKPLKGLFHCPQKGQLGARPPKGSTWMLAHLGERLNEFSDRREGYPREATVVTRRDGLDPVGIGVVVLQLPRVVALLAPVAATCISVTIDIGADELLGLSIHVTVRVTRLALATVD